MSSVGIPPGDDSNHLDPMLAIIDAIDDSIGTASRTVSIRQRWLQSLANPSGVLQERADDEFVRRERDGFGQLISELSAGTRRDEEFKALAGQAGFPRRRIAFVSSSSDSPSPRASSSSDATSC